MSASFVVGPSQYLKGKDFVWPIQCATNIQVIHGGIHISCHHHPSTWHMVEGHHPVMRDTHTRNLWGQLTPQIQDLLQQFLMMKLHLGVSIIMLTWFLVDNHVYHAFITCFITVLVRNPEDVINCFESVKEMMIKEKLSRNAALKRLKRQLTSLKRVHAIYQLSVTRPEKYKEVGQTFQKRFI